MNCPTWGIVAVDTRPSTELLYADPFIVFTDVTVLVVLQGLP